MLSGYSICVQLNKDVSVVFNSPTIKESYWDGAHVAHSIVFNELRVLSVFTFTS